MYKKNYELILNKRNGKIKAGKNQNTLLNVLIGFNNKIQMPYEFYKLAKIKNRFSEIDIITDLSLYRAKKKNNTLWYKIINETNFVSATVPIYSVKTNQGKIDCNELLDTIIEQMEEGVGLITLHITCSRELYKKSLKRLVPVTSRGGAIVLKDLFLSNRTSDNVYVEILPELIKYAKLNNTVLSIGSTFRSANIIDSFDAVQIAEIESQVNFANYISSEDVGVIIETPGHASPENIKKVNLKLQESDYPIMPLGPIPTDIAINSDQIAGAIGAVLMGTDYRADILSIVTSKEHTGSIPKVSDILEAINTYKIAAHIIDLNKTNNIDIDKKIAIERAKNQTCIYGKKSKGCSRCGEKCPLKHNFKI